MKDREEEWQELCKLAAIEQDPKNLLKLTSRIGELLEEKERRLRGLRAGDGTLDKKRIFQIAYTEGLLITRAELLKAHGYEVVSVLSNEAAKRHLDKSQRYDLFIVGHAAPRETREAMFRWLRAAFPKSKILALTSPYEGQLSGADYSVPLSDPEAWLGAVVSAASSNDTRTSRQSG